MHEIRQCILVSYFVQCQHLCETCGCVVNNVFSLRSASHAFFLPFAAAVISLLTKPYLLLPLTCCLVLYAVCLLWCVCAVCFIAVCCSEVCCYSVMQWSAVHH